MDSSYFRTILLGVVLAIFVVPFGGLATLPALLVIAALVLFDLWRQLRRKEAIRAGVPQPTTNEIEARRVRQQRIGIAVVGVAVVALVIAYAVSK